MSRQRQRVLLRQISRQTFRLQQSILLCYWLIPKSNNLLSCLYSISLAEVGISAGIRSAAWTNSGSLVLELHQYSSSLLQSAAACVFLYLPRLIIPAEIL
ncbi:hypothetical protein V6N13_061148 [Hibiscus sabdariffa]